MTSIQSHPQVAAISGLPCQCEFGRLRVGETFNYRDQVYRKDTELSAILIRWMPNAEELSEVVSHRFFPEIIVEILEDSGPQKGDGGH